MLPRVNQRLSLDEAIQALRRDPTHPVLVKVDQGLTVEVRAVEPANEGAPVAAKKKTAAEGESGAELDALFTRQQGNRHVPDLK